MNILSHPLQIIIIIIHFNSMLLFESINFAHRVIEMFAHQVLLGELLVSVVFFEGLQNIGYFVAHFNEMVLVIAFSHPLSRGSMSLNSLAKVVLNIAFTDQTDLSMFHYNAMIFHVNRPAVVGHHV